MNAFRDAVEKLRDHTREQLQEALQTAVVYGDTLQVAAIIAEMNARDVHDFEARGFRHEESERVIRDSLDW
jgi:hypothetical protein